MKEVCSPVIYVTGDLHGDIERFADKAIKKLKKGDTLIVLGDFGFLWSGDKAEQKHLKWLTKRRYRILFIDGCHENFDLLRDYPVEDFMGGRARHIGGNLYYIQRGSILEIEGKSCCASAAPRAGTKRTGRKALTGGGRNCPPATSWNTAPRT